MRVDFLAAITALFVTSPVLAELPRVVDGRPHTLGVGQRSAYPPPSFGVDSPSSFHEAPSTLGNPPKSEYLWPPYVLQHYLGPYGYPAAANAGRAGVWRAPSTYNRYFNRGYSPHSAYRDRRYASPRYRPRAGGMFER